MTWEGQIAPQARQRNRAFSAGSAAIYRESRFRVVWCFKIKEPLWCVIIAGVTLVMGEGLIWDGAFAESDARSHCLSSNVHGAKAIWACNVAIKKEPKNGELWNARGFEWIGQGHYDRAIDDFNEAIRLNSEHAEAFYNRGRARELKKDFHGALDDFNRFIELDPSDPV
jgi:tetratricopeptide (TPR) repeat protein